MILCQAIHSYRHLMNFFIDILCLICPICTCELVKSLADNSDVEKMKSETRII